MRWLYTVWLFVTNASSGQKYSSFPSYKWLARSFFYCWNWRIFLTKGPEWYILISVDMNSSLEYNVFHRFFVYHTSSIHQNLWFQYYFFFLKNIHALNRNNKILRIMWLSIVLYLFYKKPKRIWNWVRYVTFNHIFYKDKGSTVLSTGENCSVKHWLPGRGGPGGIFDAQKWTAGWFDRCTRAGHERGPCRAAPSMGLSESPPPCGLMD